MRGSPQPPPIPIGTPCSQVKTSDLVTDDELAIATATQNTMKLSFNAGLTFSVTQGANMSSEDITSLLSNSPLATQDMITSSYVYTRPDNNIVLLNSIMNALRVNFSPKISEVVCGTVNDIADIYVPNNKLVLCNMANIVVGGSTNPNLRVITVVDSSNPRKLWVLGYKY